MFARLVLLFTLVPLAEIIVLVWIGSHTSLLVPVGLVLGAGIAGAWLIRTQGWQTIVRIQAELAAGRVPAQALSDGLFVALAGMFLITPGVLTDVVAILVLLPATRRILKRYLKTHLRWRLATSMAETQNSSARDEIIDVRVIDSSSRPSSVG